ncbi:MAG TPA: maleylpyruvate isomerase family mycothiol-dependent enzyme [Actinomycetota bacterium]|nr:maleylpyruvate isomerase family mycothiol-dependent enzyme [Actinomycetota bacterium]
MTHDDYIAALRGNATAAADAARAAGMEARVPSCPEWTVRDLAAHLGGHHRWVTGNLGRAPEDGMHPIGAYEPAPEGPAAADWIEEGAAALADRLAEAGPDQRCWTWVPERSTSGFWARRTANETAVHRWDLQNAAGAPESFDADHAADAIDEYFGVMQVIGSERLRGDSETIHWHCTDTDGEWLVRLAPDGLEVSREHAKADVAMRGPASDLLLVTIGRAPASTIEVLGDAALVERWQAGAKF